MVYRGKGYRTTRRTDAERARDHARIQRDNAGMRQGMAAFVQRPVATLQQTLQQMWNRIRQRDADYENRVPVEEIVNNEINHDDESDDEHEEEEEEENDLEDMEYNSDHEDDDNKERSETDECSSVMKDYVKAIRDRLQDECRTCHFTKEKKQIKEDDKWLLKYLQQNEFWIREEYCEEMCRRLGITPSLRGYYTDVLVWFPDERFKMKPVCPTCGSSARVGVHAYPKKTYGRRVISLLRNYYIISRRYICHHCEKVTPKVKYTFMGYNEDSIKQLPRQYGQYFPAMLTHKLSIDKALLDMMRPLFDGGIRPNRFRKMILELHSKEHARRSILHEFCDEGNIISTEREKERFSSFHDKEKYDGMVPDAKWFQHTYCKEMSSIREILDMFMKIQPTKIAKLDVMYKGPKKIKRVRGQKLVDGVVSLKNEFNAKRSEFFVVTDSKDQYETPLRNMVETQQILGHAGPEIAYVDNPSKSQWLLDFIPSLRKTQDRFDALTSSDGEVENNEIHIPDNNHTEASSSDEENHNENQQNGNTIVLPDFDQWFKNNVTYLTEAEQMEQSATSIIDLLELNNSNTKVVIGLDLEWFVPSRNGQVIGKGHKTSLIQIAYRVQEEEAKVVLFHLNSNMNNLPTSLSALLQNKKVRFAGAQVSGDVSKLNRDFNLRLDVDVKAINLENMAKTRGFQLLGKSLSHIVNALFGKVVSKTSRLEDWRRRPLPLHLRKYAAKDAVYSLYCHEHLATMPDYSKPLEPREIHAGLEVDLAPYIGAASVNSIYCQGCMGATGRISMEQTWQNVPSTLIVSDDIASGRKPGYYLVEITKVHAPAMKLKGVTVKNASNRYATLGEIGDLPAKVMVPIEMLRKKREERPILLFEQNRSPQVHTSHSSAADDNVGTIDNSQRTLDEFLTHQETLDENEDDQANEDENNESEVSFDTQSGDSIVLEDCDEIMAIEDCLQLGVEANLPLPGRRWTPKAGVKLDPPPAEVLNRFSAVMGSVFHALLRMSKSISMKGSHRKGFCVALSEAFYAWDEDDLNTLYDAMKEHFDLTKREFLLLRYFRRRFFLLRVKRHCLPPAMLYWRVRAVFEVFGIALDAKTKKPLFNDLAWKRANNILNEILLGYYSDPPGIQLYRYQLKKDGSIRVDKYGIKLLDCMRDTCDVEGEHSHMNNATGKRMIGVEFADHLYASRRHRSNIDALKRNSVGFPQIDHYDPWLIDLLQDRVSDKHNILIYPHWVNTAAVYCKTKEKFGFVSLASESLKSKINEKVNLSPNLVLTPTQKFLSDRLGCKLAPMPWGTSREELKLFPQLLLQAQQRYRNMEDQEEYICELILEYVDGDITPKLPVYNRLYAKKYIHNQRVVTSYNELKEKVLALDALNTLTAHHAPALEEGNEEEEENEEEVEENETESVSESENNEVVEQRNDIEENAMSENINSRKRLAESYVRQHFRGAKVAKSSQTLIPLPAFQRTTIPCIPNCHPLFVGTIPMMPMWNTAIQLQTNHCTQRKSEPRKPRTCKIWCGGSSCIGAKTQLKKKEIRHCEWLVYFIMSEINKVNSVCSHVINSYNDDAFKMEVFLLAFYLSHSKIK